MKTYVVYLGQENARAIAITTNYEVAKQYMEETNKSLRKQYPIWIETIKVNNSITELG